jgi:surfeit locus 1 family protein
VTYRWVPTIAALCVTLLTFSLGQWQLRRAEEKRAIGAAQAVAQTQSPIVITATNIGAVPQQAGARRFEVTGEFLHEESIFIDNRTNQGKAGYHVVTPLKIAGTPIRIAILRGWVERDIRDVLKIPSLKPIVEPVRIEGFGQLSLGKTFDLLQLRSIDPALMAVPPKSQRIWPQFDPTPYSQWSGMQVSTLIIRQTSALDDGLARQWIVAQDDVPKHQGYAAQWFGLSLTTVFLWLYLAIIRPNREAKHKRFEQPIK